MCLSNREMVICPYLFYKMRGIQEHKQNAKQFLESLAVLLMHLRILANYGVYSSPTFLMRFLLFCSTKKIAIGMPITI